jgi:hypothetical protein
MGHAGKGCELESLNSTFSRSFLVDVYLPWKLRQIAQY